MTKPPVQGSIDKVLFNIVSKIDADDVHKMIMGTEHDIPQVLAESQTVKTRQGYVLQVKGLIPEGARYIKEHSVMEMTFTRRKLPFSFLVAVDKSFSMKKPFDGELSKADALCQELADFFELNAGSQNQLGCISFGLDWELLFEPGVLEMDDLQQVRKKLQGINNSGRATPSAAMSAAQEIFETQGPGHLKRLLLVTDGVDDFGQHPLELVPALREQGIIVDIIFLGTELDRSSREILWDVVKGTRGRFHQAVDRQGLEDIFREMYQSIIISITEPKGVDVIAATPSPFGAGEQESDYEDDDISPGSIVLEDENINIEDTTGTPKIIAPGESDPSTIETASKRDQALRISGEHEEMSSEEEPPEEDEEISDVLVIGGELPQDEEQGEEEQSEDDDRFHKTPTFLESLKNLFLKIKKVFWDTD